MKKILMLLILVLFTSCSNDDLIAVEGDETALEGEWTLTNISCFCGFPDPPEFELTQVIFDTASNEISVIQLGNQLYFRENGIYSYSVGQNQITLQDGRSYEFAVEDNTLQLNFVDEPQIADDEILYTFSKN